MWAGRKGDKKGLEDYKKRRSLERLLKLTGIIYSNFSDYFLDGIALISGSMIQNYIGLIKKERYGDLDLNILKNRDGDIFVKELKSFLEEKNGFGRIQIKIRENLSGVIYTNLGGIDLFRNEWIDSDIEGICEIFPGVFTHYLSKEYMIKAHLRSYRYIRDHKEIYRIEHWNRKILSHQNSLSQMKDADVPKYLVEEIKRELDEKL